MSFDNILKFTEKYYTNKVETHGATAKGVDWNSTESQNLRFEQLIKAWDTSIHFSVNDYGCGYGALVDYMVTKGHKFQYRGFDLSGKMIEKAKETHDNSNQVMFFNDISYLTVADYSIASGIFNVKLETSNEEWQQYIISTLHKINGLSSKGFSFNALTKYSDKECMRNDLHYADPLMLFDYCKRNFSKYVSLLHDYPLYEFSILVRK